MTLFSLSRKVAVVTGGGSGIGKAVAELFSKQGATVFILESNAVAAEETATRITSAQGKAYALPTNVTSYAEVTKAFASVIEKSNQLDILVNCAGIAHIGNIENTTEDDFDRVLSVNVKGVFHCMKAAIPKMKTTGGVILNISSIASTVGIADRFAYSMSKGAVLSMTISVAQDYLHQNIRCNCISPARIHTPFVDGFLSKNYPGQEKEMFKKLSATQPIGRMGSPEEVAWLALYLCSDEAGFVTGNDYPIDGGSIRLKN